LTYISAQLDVPPSTKPGDRIPATRNPHDEHEVRVA
jgi:hypothetical protein